MSIIDKWFGPRLPSVGPRYGSLSKVYEQSITLDGGATAEEHFLALGLADTLPPNATVQACIVGPTNAAPGTTTSVDANLIVTDGTSWGVALFFRSVTGNLASGARTVRITVTPNAEVVS